MYAFFLACAVLGGVILVAQLVLGMVGFDADHDVDVDLDGDAHHGVHALGHGLDLWSARSITAGVAFFGLAGAAATSAGWRPGPVLLAAAVAGLAAMIAVAWLMGQLLRFEDDGSVRIEGAVGAPATVYLSIPGAQEGAGKVTLTLQGRTVEYQAITTGAPLPTGAPVIVLDVVAPDTLVVASPPDVGV